MKITTVLLDAGGVILDETPYEHAIADLIVEMLSQLVPVYSLRTYQSDIDEAVKCYVPRVSNYIFWKYMNGDRKRFDSYHEAFMRSWKERKPPLKLMAGIENEIAKISTRFDVGIAGQYGRDVLDLLRQHSLLEYFRYRYTQDDFSLTKPDPRYYEQIIEACGISPGECVMVGDRIDKDVVPAKQVGMRTIRIRVGIHKHQEPRIPFEIADCELKSVVGLAKAVSRLAAGRAGGTESDVLGQQSRG
jgi:putative hydrolase of the HAD superfamily